MFSRRVILGLGTGRCRRWLGRLGGGAPEGQLLRWCRRRQNHRRRGFPAVEERLGFVILVEAGNVAYGLSQAAGAGAGAPRCGGSPGPRLIGRHEVARGIDVDGRPRFAGPAAVAIAELSGHDLGQAGVGQCAVRRPCAGFRIGRVYWDCFSRMVTRRAMSPPASGSRPSRRSSYGTGNIRSLRTMTAASGAS